MAGARFAKYMRPLVDALRELGNSGAPSEVLSGLGIDLAKRDSVYEGIPLHLEKGQVRLFWACGVTPQAVATASRVPFMISHKPGHMFVSDLTVVRSSGIKPYQARLTKEVLPWTTIKVALREGSSSKQAY